MREKDSPASGGESNSTGWEFGFPADGGKPLSVFDQFDDKMPVPPGGTVMEKARREKAKREQKAALLAARNAAEAKLQRKPKNSDWVDEKKRQDMLTGRARLSAYRSALRRMANAKEAKEGDERRRHARVMEQIEREKRVHAEQDHLQHQAENAERRRREAEEAALAREREKEEVWQVVMSHHNYEREMTPEEEAAEVDQHNKEETEELSKLGHDQILDFVRKHSRHHLEGASEAGQDEVEEDETKGGR